MTGARGDRRRPAAPDEGDRERRSPGDIPEISRAEASAFRLRRHHLDDRLRGPKIAAALVDMNGAQAQLLSAAWTSVWARVRDVDIQSLSAQLGTKRSLVRAWCMRRTLFIVPSSHLALYSRGSTRRAEKEVRWLLNRGVARKKVDGILEKVLAVLDEPLTRSGIAGRLHERFGAAISARRGGGWGSSRGVPWARIDGVDLPVGYLLHLVGARGVVCSGPSQGAESTYVRADAWVPGWKDSSVPVAERELLVHYLRSFAPATPRDFAVWSGLRLGDAMEIFAALTERIVPVRSDGREAWVLREDLGEFGRSDRAGTSIRLLPNFDTYLLGHADHHPLVPAGQLRRVYRPQGWIAPTLLVDGVVAGVWSSKLNGRRLEVRVEALRPLPSSLRQQLREESASLARFLGADAADLRISR